tara:strand:- start:19 stop:1737 length:1719 start_codon:yes stop_codon:yes gene_type:complete
MGRYNLTVAKTSLGQLMTKEDFGIIFGVGTFIYALSFLFNGPLVDRIGGRKGMLLALFGSTIANALMGYYLYHILSLSDPGSGALRWVFSGLYGMNMYFQSFGAVSIVKVNAHWFHVKERGGFSGIFGTMISSGIFLAFTVNGWLLSWAESWGEGSYQWVVFVAPSILLALMWAIEWMILKDEPSHAGLAHLDTGDGVGVDSGEPVPTRVLLKNILTHPIIITVALVEFCTGVLRNGVMHWFPIYAKEVWVLPGNHFLRYGRWDEPVLTGALFLIAIISLVFGFKASGKQKAWFFIGAAGSFLAPFLQAGWGGILFVAGVVGGNLAGWVSDLFFQSRRAPSAAGLYAVLVVCSGLMIFALASPTNKVASVKSGVGLLTGDRILSVAGVDTSAGWEKIGPAIACIPATCIDSIWDQKKCRCTSSSGKRGARVESTGKIPMIILRNGNKTQIQLKDPLPVQRAGDKRVLKASPTLSLSPFVLGTLVFLMSLCVIGSHGLLSGTATMDFGGRRGAATAVGVIDGFVYAGTAVQSVALGYLTSENWNYWPLFLLPFGIIGLLLLLKIWNASPETAK